VSTQSPCVKDTITEFLFTLPRMMLGGEEQKPKKGAKKAPVVSEAAKAALETIKVGLYKLNTVDT
jgi:hypothetical protein